MKNIRHFRHLTAAFPGKYIQGEHAIADLEYYIELLGEKGLIIASPSSFSKILPGCFLI
jgi:glycerol dehydrogenase